MSKHLHRVRSGLLNAACALYWGVLGCSSDGPVREVPRHEGTLGAEAAQLLAGSIRIPTVNPPGDERPLAAYFAGALRGAGLEAKVIDTPAGPGPAGAAQRGRALVWGLLRGRGERPPLVLLSHLDVVPAESPAWSVDPFAGIQRDGFVLGRGAQDAKGVSVVHLVALAELARRGQPLRRDIVFLGTPDEEAGGVAGAGWVARERPDLLRGARNLITEGGGVLVKGDDQPSLWSVGVTEKSPCWLRLSARGTPGHGAAPLRDAAAPKLVAALSKLDQLELPVRVLPAVEDMFAAMAPAAAEDADAFRDLSARLREDTAFRERFLAEPGYDALVRNTLAITVLEGSSRTNVVAGEVRAHLDVRLLPDEVCSKFAERVQHIVGDPEVRVEILLTFPSNRSPTDTPLFRTLERIAARHDPRAIVVPRMSIGFTDAHWFRDLGIVSYGFTPRWHRAGEERGIHGPNERISVRNLERGVTTMIEIILDFDATD